MYGVSVVTLDNVHTLLVNRCSVGIFLHYNFVIVVIDIGVVSVVSVAGFEITGPTVETVGVVIASF